MQRLRTAPTHGVSARAGCCGVAGFLKVAGMLGLAALAGCATRSSDVPPRPVDPAVYATWDCDRLADEADAVQFQAADVAYAVDARAGNNMIALGLGVTVFWPALLAMRPDGPEAAQLADLKGRFEAVGLAASRRGCGPPPEAMAAARAATLPLAPGDRLVYDERAGGEAPHMLGLRVTALKRDRIEFAVDHDGRPAAEAWWQDLAGNPVPGGRAPLLRWSRLLRPGLVLGQVVDGDLTAAHDPTQRARVRGQVVAIGPQTLGGRPFDVAVIELFGDAPPQGHGDGAGSRLDGVMAVDRRSGALLRLELRSGNPDFTLRRRLLRVEAAAALR